MLLEDHFIGAKQNLLVLPMYTLIGAFNICLLFEHSSCNFDIESLYG